MLSPLRTLLLAPAIMVAVGVAVKADAESRAAGCDLSRDWAG